MATKRIRPKLLPPTLEGVTYMNNIKIPSTSELPWVTMAVSRVTHLRLNRQQRINAHVATAKGIKKEKRKQESTVSTEFFLHWECWHCAE